MTQRVLLSAYQCGPAMGSVSQIGWEWYSRLSARARVTLVTHIRNRPALERAGAPLHDSEIVFIDTEWFAGPLFRTARLLFPRSEHAVFLLASLDFYVYDAKALRTLRKMPGPWDVCHAVTPVSPLAATRLYRLGPPLITGPWNGGLSSPSAFAEVMRNDSGWVYRIRNLGKLADRWIGCTRNARLILSANRATDEAVPLAARSKIRRMIENGVDLSVFHNGSWDPAPSDAVPLRVLFVGRLIPAKGIPFLLEAVSRVRNEVNLHVTIVGDGPSRSDTEAEIASLDLSSLVTMTGNLPLPEVSAHMRSAHLFCLPSVRESGGAVLIEAMACGVPVVAVNYGGPAEVVDDEVGRLLPADGPEALVGVLTQTLRDAARNPEEWRARGQVGRLRAEQRYGWDAKIGEALEIYRRMSGPKEETVA